MSHFMQLFAFSSGTHIGATQPRFRISLGILGVSAAASGDSGGIGCGSEYWITACAVSWVTPCSSAPVPRDGG